MKNSKKIISFVLSVVLLIAVCTSVVFYNSLKKRYDSSEKSTVAMGTIVTQKLYGDESSKHISKVIELISALEDKISFRVNGSDVSKLNNGEVLSDSTISSIIEICNSVSEDSSGSFDVTIGKVSSLWGIGEENERIPSGEEIEALLKDVNYENIKLDGNSVSLQGNGSIDLGAVGKGAACDLVKNYLEVSGLEGAVVSVGGSILAYGNYNKAGDKWQIAIRHPRNENEFLGIISLSEGFVSTSGDYEKYFQEDGVRYHHILDANTGYPANSGLVSVTVVCDGGALSDALSTACFILGEEKSKSLLEKYNASAVFVDSELNVSVVGEIDFEY